MSAHPFELEEPARPVVVTESDALDEVIRRNWVATPGEFREALLAAGYRKVAPVTDAEVEVAIARFHAAVDETWADAMRAVLEKARGIA